MYSVTVCVSFEVFSTMYNNNINNKSIFSEAKVVKVDKTSHCFTYNFFLMFKTFEQT